MPDQNYCIPVTPFKCWQYQGEDTQAIPMWVLKWVSMENEDLIYQNQDEPAVIDKGDWIVQYNSINTDLYDDEIFRERFSLVEEKE